MDTSDSLSVDSEEHVCIVNAYGSLEQGDEAVENAGMTGPSAAPLSSKTLKGTKANLGKMHQP